MERLTGFVGARNAARVVNSIKLTIVARDITARA